MTFYILFMKTCFIYWCLFKTLKIRIVHVQCHHKQHVSFFTTWFTGWWFRIHYCVTERLMRLASELLWLQCGSSSLSSLLCSFQTSAKSSALLVALVHSSSSSSQVRLQAAGFILHSMPHSVWSSWISSLIFYNIAVKQRTDTLLMLGVSYSTCIREWLMRHFFLFIVYWILLYYR